MNSFLIWITDFKGELAAIGAALLWALASVVYTRLGKRIPPTELNLSKGIVAIVMILATLGLRSGSEAVEMPAMDGLSLSLLALSGILGIGLGDTAYFAALSAIGPRRTLLLETLAPPLSAILAMLFLQELLPASAWIGILLTLLGVAWVISERTHQTAGNSLELMAGIRWGLLAAIAQAGGAVLSRAALTQTNIQPLLSTLVRLGSGMAVLSLWLILKPAARENLFKVLLSREVLLIITTTAFFSTYLGIWLQQTSLKFAPAGIAQTLSSTSPLFVIPLAIWIGDRVSLRAFLGVLVALAGVGMLFTFR
jgi:drug/metabolite transporter (DMT)-like permease